MSINQKILDLLKTTPMDRVEICFALREYKDLIVNQAINHLLIENKLMVDGGKFVIAKKKSKYNNVWTEVGDKKFQSIKEANRYSELLILEKAGEIYDLKCQVPYVVSDAVEWIGENKTLSKIKYILDFEYKIKSYRPKGFRVVVEDVKGAKLRIYILKRSLFLNRYPEIHFKEV